MLYLAMENLPDFEQEDIPCITWTLSCTPTILMPNTTVDRRDCYGWTVGDEILYQDWLNEGPEHTEDS